MLPAQMRHREGWPISAYMSRFGWISSIRQVWIVANEPNYLKRSVGHVVARAERSASSAIVRLLNMIVNRHLRAIPVTQEHMA